ncbi:MAG: hypothetical protein ACFFED_03985 [Candidatus Thorarchaeota archaeon]
MQSPELVPALLISMIITVLALIVVIRSWWKRRLLPTLLYSLAIACFSGMAIDLLLDQTYLPFRDWGILVNDHQLWMSNILLAFFVVGGFLFWFFAIMYSQYDTPPVRISLVVTFIAGGALIGELVKGDWSEILPLFIEIIAFGILILIIVIYSYRVLKVTKIPATRRIVIIYFTGFLLWIGAGPLALVASGVPGIPAWIGDLWTTPYSLGLLLVSIAVARNPRLLFISVARPLDFMVLDNQGMLIFSHRFHDYSGSMDPELVGSAISGVISLMKELLASGESLQRIDHGDSKILLEHGMHTTCLLIVSKETARFRQSLRSALLEFETTYREEIYSDTAVTTVFKPFRSRAEEIFL